MYLCDGSIRTASAILMYTRWRYHVPSEKVNYIMRVSRSRCMALARYSLFCGPDRGLDWRDSKIVPGNGNSGSRRKFNRPRLVSERS